MINIDIVVIIPVYNCKNYLEQAVNSVLRQPYHRISIVLVDDGSTDGSGELCDELVSGSDRVTVLHQKNAGVSAARNAGIEYVLNEVDSNDNKLYVAFLDADDGWTDGFFDENVVQLLQKEYDLIGFQSCNCNAQLQTYGVPGSMESGAYTGGQSSVWLHAKQHFAAMLYSGEFLQMNNIRFFEELKYSEDKIFSMQCMYLAESIFLENRLMYLYRHIGNSAMSRRKYGIPYFVPIINGYLKLDDLMRHVPSKQGKEPLVEGRVLANIYVMEMIAEHFQFLRPKKEVDEILERFPQYILIAEATGEYSNLSPNPAYIKYKNHPFSYAIHNNLIGGIKLCKKMARRLVRTRK